MPVSTKERVAGLPDTEWLDRELTMDWNNPAGPLFMSGRYAEFEITMTGSGGNSNPGGDTGCYMCTGSWCGSWGYDCL